MHRPPVGGGTLCCTTESVGRNGNRTKFGRHALRWVTEQLYKRDYNESDGAEVGRRYGGIRERGANQQVKAKL